MGIGVDTSGSGNDLTMRYPHVKSTRVQDGMTVSMIGTLGKVPEVGTLAFRLRVGVCAGVDRVSIYVDSCRACLFLHVSLSHTHIFL